MKHTIYLMSVVIVLLFTNVTTYAQIITDVAGGPSGTLTIGGPATSSGLGGIAGTAVDKKGNLYIAAVDYSLILKVDRLGIITIFAGNLSSGAPFGGDGGPATSAELWNPVAVASDDSGNIYIADANNNRIRKVDTAGIITTIAGVSYVIGGYTYGAFSGDGGLADTAKLNQPSAVAVDDSGNVYFSDTYNQRVRKINRAGIITTIAGNGYGAGVSGIGVYSGDGGPAVNASLNVPVGLALDHAGNLYIADANNNRIRKVDTSGIITTFAGNGTAGFSGDGGLATSAKLNSPGGVSVDNNGNVYIADDNNNVIRKVNTSGIISTFAGTGIAGFSGDSGPALSAKLDLPTRVTADKAGNVFISDYMNAEVRKVSGISGNINVCIDTTAMLYDSAVSGGSWISTNPAVATIDAVTGNVTTVATGSTVINYIIGTDTASTPLYVVDKPDAGAITGVDSICPGNTIMLTDAAFGGVWNSQDTSIAVVISPGDIKGLVSGYDTITYKVTAAGCSAVAAFVVKVMTFCDAGINGLTSNDAINVFPNPASRSFTIDLPASEPASTITVSDIFGKVVATTNVAANTKNAAFNLSNLPAGTYVIKVCNNSGNSVRKLILE